VAIGSAEGGAWIGFVRTSSGYRLACAGADGAAVISPSEGALRHDELLAAAIAHFEEAFDPPPPSLEATQADLGALVRWLSSSELDAPRRAILATAVDAIDDGLAADVVVARLVRARSSASERTARHADEQADPVDLLVTRCRASGAAIRAPREGSA
jgi:hypothetical protein